MQISDHVYLVGSEQFGLSHPLDSSCYLLDGGSALGLVDSGLGLGVDDILANVEASGFDSKKISHLLITHAHVGHWGGAGLLRERTGAEVWAPAEQQNYMIHPNEEPGIRLNYKFGRYPPGFQVQACPPDHTFNNGDQVVIGNLELQILTVQGHTKDSTCFLFKEGTRRALLTGDVVFYGGRLGIQNLEGFSFDDYRRDIHKLANLDIDMLLPGHGVFVLKRGQKHIERAIHKLSDFVMPETFFEENEFMWSREYHDLMTE